MDPVQPDAVIKWLVHGCRTQVTAIVHIFHFFYTKCVQPAISQKCEICDNNALGQNSIYVPYININYTVF